MYIYFFSLRRVCAPSRSWALGGEVQLSPPCGVRVPKTGVCEGSGHPDLQEDPGAPPARCFPRIHFVRCFVCPPKQRGIVLSRRLKRLSAAYRAELQCVLPGRPVSVPGCFVLLGAVFWGIEEEKT